MSGPTVKKVGMGAVAALLALVLLGVFVVFNSRPGLIEERDFLSHPDVLKLGSERVPTSGVAQASQGTGCMPTVGIVSGLTMANNINAAIAALISSNSGSTAPATDCSAAAVLGQFWLDTTSAQYRKLKYYDGTSWLIVATLDSTNHLVVEPIGGGAASIASAGTTDLWSTPEANITVSGTTTITQLANASAVPGTLKVVQFSGAGLTLTYDATKLILPTTASITTAAGDYAVVMALTSTNVAVISYNRATGSALAASNASVGAAALAASAIGMNAANNLELDVSFASNNLTLTVTGVNGSTPSASNPVLVSFRDTTTSTGKEIFGQITSALSFTVNSGNTLGTVSATPARVWVELICQTQSGTSCTSVLLGASVQSTATSCLPLVEGSTVNTGAGTTGGSAAGTIYTSAASLTGKAFRIAGFVELTETTAGTWASVTPLIKVFGPGDRKPCEPVQTVYSTTTTHTTNASTTKTATNLTGTITPTSAMNLVKVDARGQWEQNTGGSPNTNIAFASLWRGTGSTQIGNISGLNSPSGATGSGLAALFALDNPQSASSTQYGVYIQQATGTDTADFLGTSGSVPTNTGVMIIEEIMGALEPANDDQPMSAIG